MNRRITAMSPGFSFGVISHEVIANAAFLCIFFWKFLLHFCRSFQAFIQAFCKIVRVERKAKLLKKSHEGKEIVPSLENGGQFWISFAPFSNKFIKIPFLFGRIFGPNVTSRRPSPRGSIAPDGCQLIGQSTEKQSVRSRKHIHSHFDLKIAIFSTALVLGNRSMCLFLL